MEYLHNSHLGLERLKRLKIWIVDDDIDLCEAYSESLSEFFDITFRFDDSLKALEMLKQMNAQEIPNVIVLDQHMPQLDGVKFCKELLKLRLSIGVLLVSGDQSELSDDEADQLDVFERIQKPCSTNEICMAIYEHCAFHHLCGQIADEILSLCRSATENCEFFLGLHADLEKAFHAPIRKRASSLSAIQNVEQRIKEREGILPAQSPLLSLLDEFRMRNRKGNAHAFI